MKDHEWLPRIDPDVCIGCSECILACPTQALGQYDAKATLIYPDLCTYCAVCESICSVGAIELPYLVCKIETRQGGEKS